MKYQSLLLFVVFVFFVVPSSQSQSKGAMLYTGTWQRTILAIDEAQGKVVDQIQLNTGTPQGLSLSYDKKKIYVSTWNNGIEVIDLATRKVTNSFVLSEGERIVRLRGFAPDPTDQFLYTTINVAVKKIDRFEIEKPKFAVIDLAQKKIVKTFDFPKEFDSPFGFQASYRVSPDGKPLVLDRDEGVRAQIDHAKMAALKPAFRPEGKGVVTAANSSQISDGASAVLLASAQAARADGLKARARFRARVAVGSDPTMQLTGVIPATQLALAKAGLTIRDLDWIEINEAFATVVLSWAKELKPDMAKVNPWGGAIAHGHPLGATGAGLMAKMLAGLEATGGTLGLQVMCIGHGQATATVIERL